MKKYLILISLAVFFPLFVSAEGFPSFPMSFYGQAKLNGQNLPVGSKLQVFSNNSLNGEMVVGDNGVYGDNTVIGKKLIISEYSGSELLFKYVLPGGDALAGDNLVKYAGVFESGRTLQLDLNFSKAVVSNSSSNSSSGGGSGGASVIKTINIVPLVATTSKQIKVSTSTTELGKKVLGEKIVDYTSFLSLYGLDKDLAEKISGSEAEKIFSWQDYVSMSKINESIYNKIVANRGNLDKVNKMSIAYFIQFGTPTTKRLGAGEQAGSLSSFISAFGRIPGSSLDWQDVVKIANGRWPSQKSELSEEKAKSKFKKTYSREANMKNQNDNAAVTIMAYGLRPVSRNTNNEKAAILSFKAIYKKQPVSAEEWDIVRAIAYSGAKR